MSSDDPQKIWSEYFQRKKAQRMEEASGLSKLMQDAGITEETVLALDFVHFGNSKEDLEALSNQLSENYSMRVVENDEEGYWVAKGTTRPNGINLSQEQLFGWVEFMSDVAQSYACVFSTWSLEAPSLGVQFHSEKIESAS